MIGSTLNQRFVLETELGRGGMGTVYRATDQILQRTVAIKVLKEAAGEEMGRRLRIEAQILARLVHDHIVRLYDFGADEGTYYFVMEEIDGASFLKRWKRLLLPERVRILSEAAEALDYAHHQGVIHRDVKPANVLLTSADQAKLSDFGLSLLADSMQEQGVVRGTPHYMSPEQARGRRLDFRTDLYSLGVILYECATGAPPFQGHVASIMSQHVGTEPEPPRLRNPEISIDFERMILRLLAKDPDDRPSSGREVAGQLRLLHDEGRLTLNAEVSAPVAERPVGPSVIEAVPVRSREGSPSLEDRLVGSSAVASSPSKTPVAGSSLARDMLVAVEAEPIALSPEDRYLCGHYLAYLLGGSRRRGFLQRRPLDPLNADRARLLLAMSYLCTVEADDAALARGAQLLDARPDVRPALSPTHVMKYLAGRGSPRKRKQFRQLRRRLGEMSTYATRHLLDEHGVLNPGLMPQVLEDLKRIAPDRTEVDDQLIQRWNRVAEVWRRNAEFRESILRYATRRAYRDPASAELWPEVVYPLIERARWQRRVRSRAEEVWDKLAENLHLPDAGLRMDRAFTEAVPAHVVANLDQAIDEFEDEPQLEEADQRGDREVSGASGPVFRAESFDDIEPIDDSASGMIRLSPPEPFRPTLGECRQLWKDAIAALRSSGGGAGAKTIPIGPYRLAAVASIRGRSAGQLALQGLPNKQIELLLPPFTGGGSGSKPVLAIWLYENQSMAIAYIDHLGTQRYITWDAATGVQRNHQASEDFNRELYQLGYEVPHGLDRVLTRHYRPSNPV